MLTKIKTNKTVNRVRNFPFECKTILHTVPKAAFAPSDKHTPTAEKHKENSCSRCSLLASVFSLPAPCLCRACAKCAPSQLSSMKEMAPGGVYLSGELLCLRGNKHQQNVKTSPGQPRGVMVPLVLLVHPDPPWSTFLVKFQNVWIRMDRSGPHSNIFLIR